MLRLWWKAAETGGSCGALAWRVIGRLTSSRAVRYSAATLGSAFLIGLFLPLSWPLDSSHYLRFPASGEMVDADGRLLYAYLNADSQWCFDRSLDELGPRIVQATIATEDKRFYVHPGVDPVAFVRAVWGNLAGARVVSGASTLTMQVVKRADKSPRTVLGKAVQMQRALRLERACAKDDILRTYLNTAPYGLNLVGVEAASRRFFGKPAHELTIAEAALLAGLPKAPSKLMPLSNQDAALRRRDYVLRRMCEEGFITERERTEAAAEPLGARWCDFPQLSPHLAARLRTQAADGRKVRVTLRMAVQEETERLVRLATDRYRGDINNAAAIVVDAASCDVIARVGSGDFFRTPGGGQVDICLAPRSPGSALKPFTYALGIENNVLYDCEMLLDDSLDFGHYSPQNFDEGYNGLISAADALRHSLNIPAVLVLDRITPDTLYTFLRGAGLSTLTRTADEYGLGLTLGNCEVRLEELVAVYAMLANLGEYRPLRTVITEDAPVTPRRLLSTGTCTKLFEMLEQALPDEWEANIVRATGILPRACWKTGTSTGQRDAWAFVFNRQYVVGVWMGNNDGRPSSRLVGMRTALPLAARILRSLEPTTAPEWPETAGELKTVRVCALSGLPATEWCMRTREASLPRDQFLHRVCDVHYPRRGGTTDSIAEHWPGSARGWDLANIGAPVADIAEDASNRRLAALQIKEPAHQAEYVLTGEPQGDRIRLSASLDADGPLFWYLDDRYLGTSTPQNRLLLDLAAGNHTLACMTPQGTHATVTFNVTEPSSVAKFSTN